MDDEILLEDVLLEVVTMIVGLLLDLLVTVDNVFELDLVEDVDLVDVVCLVVDELCLVLDVLLDD
jgi:hypothetical protein